MCGQELSDRQLIILSHFAKITSISGLDQLLNIVIEETPRLLCAAGCSVYLVPELVPQYDGTLVERDGSVTKAEELQKDFMVLAATSRSSAKQLVGKAFYPQGEGLSGWVFERGRPLRLKDANDRSELGEIDPDLHWSDRYGGSSEYYGPMDKKSVLIVPLVADTRTIGVLKVPAAVDKQPFTEADEQIATIIAQIIAGVIRQTWVVQEQGRRIYRLVEISAEEDPEKVLKSVTESLSQMLDCRCRLYCRVEDGSCVELAVEDGERVSPEHLATCARGQDLVGWVFRTGKPLLISDVHDYAQGRHLDDSRLEAISDNANINEEDRFLKPEQLDSSQSMDNTMPFLAVPVRATDGSVYGVLCADHVTCGNDRRVTPFDRSELQLAQSFASTISVAIENERERQLGALLISLGRHSDPATLFGMVFDGVPGLISGSGCRIYTLEHGAQGSSLRSVRPSQEAPGQGAEFVDVIYRVGEGKTGFCALTGDTLIVNHYGTGTLACQAMRTEKARIASGHPADFVADLVDEGGQRVGIIQLRRGVEMTQEAQQEFQVFARSLVVRRGNGLPSPRQKQYAKLSSSPSWSFVAAPVKTVSGELYGVITMKRPVDCFPFSADDVSLLETVARRLAEVIHILTMQKQREQLLTTLAHEINTPLTGMLADSENLMKESPDNSELRELSRHNLEQGRRLHLLSETIMAVISGQIPAREFTIHSIYRPLMEAIELFESEAREKGCDIHPPRSGGAGFPDIEMSLSDLTLAFKNIVHNAVKYSFNPPQGQDMRRYVRITGRWADVRHSHYSVSVENYGVGINEEEVEKELIFKPHYRGTKASDRRRTGAGLGLAHARQIVEELHHGTIAVTSQRLPGEGDPHLTTVTVTLPVKRPHAENSTIIRPKQ